MKQKFLRLALSNVLMFLTIQLVGIPSALAKIQAPNNVLLIQCNHVTYLVESHLLYDALHHPTGRVFMIEAHDNYAGQLLWTKPIYTIHYKMDLETDVQDVFVKSLEIRNNTLYIMDANNHEYSLPISN